MMKKKKSGKATTTQSKANSFPVRQQLILFTILVCAFVFFVDLQFRHPKLQNKATDLRYLHSRAAVYNPSENHSILTNRAAFHLNEFNCNPSLGVYSSSGSLLTNPNLCFGCSSPYLNVSQSCTCTGSCSAARPKVIFGLGTGRCGTVSLSKLLSRLSRVGRNNAVVHEPIPMLPLRPQINATFLKAHLDRILGTYPTNPSFFSTMQRSSRSVLPLKVHSSALINQQLQADSTMNTRMEMFKKISAQTSGYNDETTDISANDGTSVTRDFFVGGVAFYYLPYVDSIIRAIPSAQFVVLERAKADVVRSYAVKSRRIDLWSTCVNEDSLPPSELSINETNAFYKKWALFFPKYDTADCSNATLAMESALGQYWDEYASTTRVLQNKYPYNVRVFDVPSIFEDLNKTKEMLDWLDLRGKKVNLDLLKKKNNCGYETCKKHLIDTEWTFKLEFYRTNNDRGFNKNKEVYTVSFDVTLRDRGKLEIRTHVNNSSTLLVEVLDLEKSKWSSFEESEDFTLSLITSKAFEIPFLSSIQDALSHKVIKGSKIQLTTRQKINNNMGSSSAIKKIASRANLMAQREGTIMVEKPDHSNPLNSNFNSNINKRVRRGYIFDGQISGSFRAIRRWKASTENQTTTTLQ